MGADAVSLTALYRQESMKNISTSVGNNVILRRGIWLFFFLLIFEGALRKWVFPGLATPLLIIRDPLALWLILMTWRRGLLPANFYLSGMILIGVCSTFTAVFFGHGSILVALYGARIFILYFPLIFVIGRLFSRPDVINVGKALVWLAIPMTVLVTLQFYSPQSAWVNRGVGGDMSGAGFGEINGYFRPPGTFSFTNGTASFYGLLSPFVIYFWLSYKKVNRLILICVTACLLAAIPLSISRGLFFQVIVAFLFSIIAVLHKSGHAWRILLACIGGLFVLAVLWQLSFFQTATQTFIARFDIANQQEGGLEGVILDRFLGGMIGALNDASSIPFWGYGLGMGTNVGSMLLLGKQLFLIAEEEWGRLIGELGPMLGIGVVFLRVGLTIKIAGACFRKLSTGDILPWMLLSFGSLSLAQAQWAQPTSLGFSILIAGLMIASLRSYPDQA